jgi:DNA mismatch endonuclease (patch repair protein)
MPDVFDKETRSAVMRKVLGKGNKSTELRLITIFRELGIKGWRRNYKVKGRPDFVFPEKRISVFVDGCFWHGHGCRNIRPKENAEF